MSTKLQKGDLKTEFEKYVVLGRNLPKQAPDVMLIAYGYYKQALFGNNLNARPTENSNIIETLKHDQWKRLEGMSCDEAMEKYIEFIKLLLKQIGTAE